MSHDKAGKTEAVESRYRELQVLYEQAKKREAELESASNLKSEFLSVISHELKTPLNLIMSHLGMIHDGILGEINPAQKEALRKSQRCCGELLTMVTALLNVATLEAGAVKVESHAVHLGSFINELRTLYSVPLGRDINLIWDYPADLPVIQTDGAKLRHILQNLINNATKFTDKGNITVSIRAVPEQRRVQFKVADAGIGIPQEMLPVIFKMFRQVNGSGKRNYGGVGMGLYIVKTFAEMLKGEVEVESEYGKGSTFTVTLPYSLE